jgi:hypothetical protein
MKLSIIFNSFVILKMPPNKTIQHERATGVFYAWLAALAPAG